MEEQEENLNEENQKENIKDNLEENSNIDNEELKNNDINLSQENISEKESKKEEIKKDLYNIEENPNNSDNKNDAKSTSIEKQDISEDIEQNQSIKNNQDINNYTEESNNTNTNKNTKIFNSNKKPISPEFSLYLERVEGYIKKKEERLNELKKDVEEKEKRTMKEKPDISQIYAGNRHPELIVPLTEWRTEQYMAQNIRAYWVLTQRTLLEIADTCPTTKEELLAVNGFGPAKWKQYGEEILELIARYRKD